MCTFIGNDITTTATTTTTTITTTASKTPSPKVYWLLPLYQKLFWIILHPLITLILIQLYELINIISFLQVKTQGIKHFQFSSVQSLSCVWLLTTPWTAACQASLSITNSQSPPKPMSIVLVMPSNHLILCCPLLILLSNFPSIRVPSNGSALCIMWPKYWSFSFNIGY